MSLISEREQHVTQWMLVFLDSARGYLQKGVEHGSIESVASRTHEAYDSTDVEHNRMPGEERDRLLEPCLCERFGTGDDLDFSNSALEVLQCCQL